MPVSTLNPKKRRNPLMVSISKRVNSSTSRHVGDNNYVLLTLVFSADSWCADGVAVEWAPGLQKALKRGTRPPDKLFICPNCGNRYTQRPNLSRHLKLECGKEPLFCCPFCECRCHHKSNLQRHIMRKHPVSVSKND